MDALLALVALGALLSAFLLRRMTLLLRELVKQGEAQTVVLKEIREAVREQ